MWPFKPKPAGKVAVTCDQLAEGLFDLCFSGARSLGQQLQTEFRGTSFAVDGDKEGRLLLESLILHLWLISKVLASEKPVLDSVHSRFFEYIRSRSSNPNALEAVQAKVGDRYGRYYAAWDEKAKGSQFVLGLEIFQCLVNDGRPDKELLGHSIVDVLMSVLGFMKAVDTARSKYEIDEP